MAKKILNIIEQAGDRGITRRQIEKSIKTTGCDCESWINTFLESNTIEICGESKSGAQLLRLVKRQCCGCLVADDIYFISTMYFSLPEFPSECNIVTNNQLLLRDVLVCSPNNEHVKLGGQYDPHYEFENYPEFKMCWRNARITIKDKIDEGSYNEIFLFFRTCRRPIKGKNTHHISGFYNIDFDKTWVDPNYEAPVIYAKEAKFFTLESSINITDFIKKTHLTRYPFNSESKSGKYKDFFIGMYDTIRDRKNSLDEYVTETRNIESIFKYHEYEEGLYGTCNECRSQKSCSLYKRIKNKGKLYHQLPLSIANVINEYYKKIIEV